MTERNAAVHAALRLKFQDFRIRGNLHFLEVELALLERTICMRLTLNVIECAFQILSHNSCLLLSISCCAWCG